MWNVAGLALALFIAVIAWRKSLASGGYYAAGVYGMTARAHRRYALTSLGFAVFFAIAWVLRQETAGLVGLTLYALIAVLYAASFLRGAELDE